MKIMFFIQGMKSGGAERVVSVLCNGLADKGHQVVLGLTETTETVAYSLHEKLVIKDVTSKKGNVFRRRLLGIKKMRRLIKEERPDVVISFITRTNIYAIIAAMGTRVPVIISERNDPARDPKSRFTKALRNIVYPLCDGCVFQTGYAREYFGKRLATKSVVIPNPVSGEVVVKGNNERREKRVVCACRLEPQKNVDMLIEAFCLAIKEDKEYRLEVYGTGSLKDSLTTKIKKLKLEDKVVLKGYAANVIEIMSQSEIFALSSDYEGMPNALIEAMCVGCACVATDSPAFGAREFIINGENGILVRVGDAKAMAEALKRMMSDNDFRRKCGSNAQKVYERVEANTIIDLWIEYINNICHI